MSLKAIISTIISNTLVLAQFYPYKHLYYNVPRYDTLLWKSKDFNNRFLLLNFSTKKSPFVRKWNTVLP